MKHASATWLGPPLLTLQGPDFDRACTDLMRVVEADYVPTLIVGIRTGGLIVAQAMALATSPRLTVFPLTCRRVTTDAKSRLPLLRTMLPAAKGVAVAAYGVAVAAAEARGREP